MEGLVPAFVAALIAQALGRPAWLAAMLADRRDESFASILIALVLASGFVAGLATVAALAIYPMLTPNARTLLLALALVTAGVSALLPVQRPKIPDWPRIGFFLTCLVILRPGEAVQFLIFGIGVSAGQPWFAGIGGALGAMAGCIPAMLIGEAQWRVLPFGPLRIASGVGFLFFGAITALGALRLI